MKQREARRGRRRPADRAGGWGGMVGEGAPGVGRAGSPHELSRK